MAILAALMISDVPYPTVPSIGFSSVRKIIGTLVVAGSVAAARRFAGRNSSSPRCSRTCSYGAIKWVILGFVGRSTHAGRDLLG